MEETEHIFVFVMEFLRQGEEEHPLHQQVMEMGDLGNAIRGTWFEGLRRGRLPNHRVPLQEGIVPLWAEERGRPYIRGFEVMLRSGQGQLFRKAFGIGYFAPLARRAAVPLIDAGILSSGETFRYLLSAFPQPPGGPPREEAGGMKVQLRRKPLRLVQRSLAGLSSAIPSGTAGADDFPCFVPSIVLQEMMEVAQATEEVESGGILMGDLCGDTDSPEVFAVIRAQITARHTEASTTRLTFTPETWSAVSDAIWLRGREEQWLGYWHAHPFPARCRDCARREECPQTPLFYSPQDYHLHQSVFAAPFMVGLVITPMDPGQDAPPLKAYGWRDGVIAERGISLYEYKERG